MMAAARKVALRVNGLRVTKAAVRPTEKEPELVVGVPLLGDFAVDSSYTLELLELLIPREMRQRLPDGGWRKVSSRMLIALLRCGAVRIAEEN